MANFPGFVTPSPQLPFNVATALSIARVTPLSIAWFSISKSESTSTARSIPVLFFRFNRANSLSASRPMSIFRFSFGSAFTVGSQLRVITSGGSSSTTNLAIPTTGQIFPNPSFGRNF